ncbi:MAG TPA: histidine kinase dimerization/phospho-acceptor domain-containing protein [Candidatus Acidoferrum sp.]|nr:histidine kinase dimerization/phospho-acceptor domain-containing protein [Candidatus Acidoferrum sp.]
MQEELICDPRAECNRQSSIMNSMLPLKVLIISDSDEKAGEFVSHLVNDGFEVVSLRIQTPEAFLTALGESAWDVVLSGHPVSGFKEMQGLELVKARENPPPFLFVTDVESTDMTAAALRGGARNSLVIGDGKHFVAAVERELRDAELRRERQRLERQVHFSKRFEAIGRLAGGIAHDFNNVLAGILGSIELELQSRSLPKDARIRGRLERMQAQAENGRRLTGQLLAFARRQVLAPSNLDLNRVVSDTCACLRRWSCRTCTSNGGCRGNSPLLWPMKVRSNK